MHLFQAETINDIYPGVIAEVLENGVSNSPRGKNTRDLGLSCIEVTDPRKRIVTNQKRKINPYFMFAEFLWIATRSNRADMIGHYNRRMWEFSDDGYSLYGAYGPRLMFQIPNVIAKIKADPSTRQAVATIFRPLDGATQTKDFPCNIMLHFLPRNGLLDLIVYVRSQDVKLGLPYDFYHWSIIQEMVASETGLPVGKYSHICGSLHAYEADLDSLSSIVNSEPEHSLESGFESAANKFISNIKEITDIESSLRRGSIKTQTDIERILEKIEAIGEADVIKDQLQALAYYKIRRNEAIDKAAILDSIEYCDLIKHLGWE